MAAKAPLRAESRTRRFSKEFTLLGLFGDTLAAMAECGAHRHAHDFAPRSPGRHRASQPVAGPSSGQVPQAALHESP